jgi:hypothetical protein
MEIEANTQDLKPEESKGHGNERRNEERAQREENDPNPQIEQVEVADNTGVTVPSELPYTWLNFAIFCMALLDFVSSQLLP